MKSYGLFCTLIVLLLSFHITTTQDNDIELLKLERTACDSNCPVYSLTYFADGSVRYIGEQNVEYEGEHEFELFQPQRLQDILDTVQNLGFFEWADAYTQQDVPDLQTVIISANINGEAHTITHYLGDFNAPVELSFLEIFLEEVLFTSITSSFQRSIADIYYNGDKPITTLETSMCFGQCPVYQLAIFDNGTLVLMTLLYTDNIGLEFVNYGSFATDIAQRAEDYGYFNWQNAYINPLWTDSPTVITSMRVGENFKRIEHDTADPNAPIGLSWLETDIKELALSLINE